MKNNVQVAPSILSADFSAMGEAVKNVQTWGADMIHCDVMDGVFVKNITFGPKMVKDIRKHTTLPLDVHLMIIEPEKYVGEFAKCGADYITVHYEACGDNLKNVLELIKFHGVKCGLVINPDTPVSAVSDVVPLCDMVLLMSVFPGFGGQKFIESVLPKIKEMRALVDSLGKDILIEVDGGVTLENVADVVNCGANVVVAGSTVFNAEDKVATISALKNAD